MELILYFWGKDQKMAESSRESIIWKGKFSYNPEEYGFEEDVNFELYISKTDNQFEGVSYDDEFRDLHPELPKVKGFIDGDKIYFVITYPVSYSIDENDKILIDQTRKGHDVIYNGTFDRTFNKWSGIWEIMQEEEIDGDEIIIQDYSTGEWEMS